MRAAERAAWQRQARAKLKPRPLSAVPDLLVTGLSYQPGTYYQGDLLHFVALEANQGEADAGSFKLQARLSKDRVWDVTDILLGDFQTVHIGADSHLTPHRAFTFWASRSTAKTGSPRATRTTTSAGRALPTSPSPYRLPGPKSRCLDSATCR